MHQAKVNPAADLIAAFLAKNAVSICEPAIAKGANISKAKKNEFYRQRRAARRSF